MHAGKQWKRDSIERQRYSSSGDDEIGLLEIDTAFGCSRLAAHGLRTHGQSFRKTQLGDNHALKGYVFINQGSISKVDTVFDCSQPNAHGLKLHEQ